MLGEKKDYIEYGFSNRVLQINSYFPATELYDISLNVGLSCEPFFDTQGILHQTVPLAFFPNAVTPEKDKKRSKCI
jgi:hypothetical protein